VLKTLSSPTAEPVMLDQLLEERYVPEPLAQMARVTRHRRPRVVVTGISVLAPKNFGKTRSPAKAGLRRLRALTRRRCRHASAAR
jgi:hypothetical protein